MHSKKHRSAVALAALASLWAGGVAAQAEPAEPARAWAFSARSVHHGEAVPLAAIDDEDQALARLDPRSGRNIAYVDDEARLSLAAGAWTWSLLARSSALLVTDESTLELVRQVTSDVMSASDRRWSARVRYESFQGGGLEAGYRFAPAAQWQAGVAAQLLQLRHWRRRTLDGQVQFESASSTYAFDLKSTQADDRLRFPFQGSTGDSGAGLLLAADAAWRNERWAASLGVRDLGWLRWSRLPQQLATLSTQTQSYDADGFVIYKPLVEGRNRQQGYTHRLPGWWTARASWRAANAGEFELSSDWVQDFGALPAVAWRQRFADVDLGLHWRFHERRAGVALGWRGWQLRAGVDRFGSQQRSRELAVGGSWTF
ncbi:hypothetical protein [Caldimonas sp. KR1-144]|uniref:hypothetical protein n=1 Tax=Caldimonas sp. KR1-144 TaxID=3400911 RepID=UPI003C0D2209